MKVQTLRVRLLGKCRGFHKVGLRSGISPIGYARRLVCYLIKGAGFMKSLGKKNWLLGASAVAALLATSVASGAELKVLPPSAGAYHGVFANIPEFPVAGDVKRLTTSFETLVGKEVALTIVGDEWINGIKFPTALVNDAKAEGKVPVVHIRPWSVKTKFLGEDARYSLQRIIDGRFDNELRVYARAVKDHLGPVMISFAPEANGEWYPWSGSFAGAGVTTSYGDRTVADGPERYRDAYRHLINIFRSERVENATWVFHVSSGSAPVAAWNNLAAYYPGNDYIDWLAVSVYSAQVASDYWYDFTAGLDAPYSELALLSPDKPIAVLEYGTIEDRQSPFRKSDWMTAALTSVKGGQYPRVKAMAYWHEQAWLPFENNDMRVSSSPEALNSYKTEIADDFFVSEALLSGPIPVDNDCLCGWVTSNSIRYCAIWKPGDATVREQRRFGDCYIEICKQLFSPDTVQNYCGGKIKMAQ